MSLPEVFAKFVARSPVPVMVHGLLAHVFDPHVLDQLYDCCSRRQHSGRLLYSLVLELMTLVVTRVEPSLRSAMRSHADRLPVLPKAVYEKIAGLETEVISATLAVTADELTAIARGLPPASEPLVAGLRTLVLDGNHLGAVHHRLGPLRGTKLAALPGTSVMLLDHQLQLFKRAYLLADGHACERDVLPQVLADLQPEDLLLADRNFCLRWFAAALQQRGSYFLLRQHLSNFPLQLQGERTLVATTDAGRVYEQAATYATPAGPCEVRRITVELVRPTRNKEAALYLVTNVPAQRLSAVEAAAAYRARWTIENAFQTLTVDLHCELDSLGYPPAALFAFCVAAMAWNAYSVARHTLLARQRAEQIPGGLSNYYLLHEIRRVWDGLRIIIEPAIWSATFGGLSRLELIHELWELSAQVNFRNYQKAPTKPHPPPQPGHSSRQRHHHASVQKILNQQ